MENLGKTITGYRKKLSLTQKDLGEKLNVSPQAVSKWENGQAEPDASTIKKLCEIFKISTDELLGNTPPADEVAVAAEPAAVDAPPFSRPAAVSAETVAPTAMEPTENVFTVNALQTASVPNAAQSYEYYKIKRNTVKSLIWGCIAGVAMFCLILFPMVYAGEAPYWFALPFAVVFGVGYFAFIMQMFWDGVINEMFFFFLKSFKMPGVIFTLDLDGLIFLILVKVGGAILGAILSVIFFLIGLIVMPIAGIMILPFATIARILKAKKLKSSV